MYRIQLDAWGFSKNALGVQSNKNGIAGRTFTPSNWLMVYLKLESFVDYTCCKFKPRSDVIAKVATEAKALAVQEAEELLALR